MRPGSLLFAVLTTLALAFPVAADDHLIKAGDLPRRTYLIHRMPSELLVVSKGELQALVETLDRDLQTDLERLDPADVHARLLMLNARAQVAIHRGEYLAAQGLLREIRSHQHREAEKLTSGVTLENILETRIQAGSLHDQRARLKGLLARAWGGMPWHLVGDYFKTARSGLQQVSREFYIQTARKNLDPPAASVSLHVPAPALTMVLTLRNQIEHILPFRNEIVAVLQEIVEAHQGERQS